MLTNAADKGLADTSGDVRISDKERIGFRILGLLIEFNGGGIIILIILAPRDKPRLIDFHVGRGDDKAVSGDLVTRLKLDDITNDKVPDRDGLHLSTLATDDGKVLIAVEALEDHEFTIFLVIGVSSDADLDEESNEDEDALNPTLSRIDDHARNDADNSEDGDNNEEHVDGASDRLHDGWLLRNGFIVPAEPGHNKEGEDM